MSHVELGICGPSGVRPMKESGPDLILMGIGAAVFILAFAATGRALRAPGPSDALPFVAGAMAGLALAAWAVLRMWRRQDDAALMEAGMLGFIFFLGLYEKAPKGSPLALFAALLPLAPAALFAWSTIRIARRADELQRRIAQEALAFGFVVSLFAALAGAALEAAGLPRLNWVWMAGVLVLACGVGIVLANRRYR
jgi:hypothetical protein